MKQMVTAFLAAVLAAAAVTGCGKDLQTLGIDRDASLTVHVVDEKGTDVQGAAVTVACSRRVELTSNASGMCTVSGLSVSRATVTAALSGLSSASRALELEEGDNSVTLQLDSLRPWSSGFEDGRFPAEFGQPETYEWTITGTEAHGGTYAAQAVINDIGESARLTFDDALVDGDSVYVSFWYKIDYVSSSKYLRFYIDGYSRLNSYRTAGWEPFIIRIPGGTHDLDWRYYSGTSAYGGAAWIDDVQISTDPPEWYSDLLAAPAFNGFEDGAIDTGWANGGDAPWRVTSGDQATGTYSITAGDILDYGEESIISITRFFPVYGNIVFNYRLISSSSNNRLEVSVDDNGTSYLYYNSYWESRSVSVSSGLHTVTFRFYRGSSSSGQVWLDDIRFPEL